MRLKDRAPTSPRISIFKHFFMWQVFTPGVVPISGYYFQWEDAITEARRIAKARAIRAIQDGAA